eukprot:gnl/Spiro4/7580_TR3974_c0_g1_i2.p4 gnl/Spiro4/7580_TR3974_c0_g1~~gnl/Spiro4/7580_TR3974_c0_g1_i2.p4  ORF type:complete len:149 (+),score=3.35 gnl/Spiro4/7580_TR3974_c0_g1_i2:6328-6774(+)
MVPRFRQYLFESIFRNGTYEDDGVNDPHDYLHHAEVGGRSVTVAFQDPHGLGRNFFMNFTVDHSFENPGTASPVDQQKVLHYVLASTHHFIRNVKPASLSFKANEANKAAPYRAFADHLSRHYGATVSNTADNKGMYTATLTFPGNDA